MGKDIDKRLILDPELTELWSNGLRSEQLEIIEQGLADLNNIRVPPISHSILNKSETTRCVRFPFPAWIASGAVMASCLVLLFLWQNPFSTRTSIPLVALSDHEVEELAALFEEDFNDSFLDSFVKDESFVMEKLL